MDRESIVQRVKDLTDAIEQSVANHNSLIGRLNEAKYLLQQFDEFVQKTTERGIKEGVANTTT